MSRRRPSVMLNFLIRALVGMAVIFFVNEFMNSRGIDARVGMNGITFLTSGIFGIPGIALLYGMVIYKTL